MNFEKVAFSLRVATKKLRPNFQVHQITILTTYPIKEMFQKLDLSRQLLKWVVELSEYEIRYKPKMAIKAQALADFITELNPTSPTECIEGWWKLKTNRSS